jgi:hypothetical protein
MVAAQPTVADGDNGSTELAEVLPRYKLGGGRRTRRPFIWKIKACGIVFI